ncbi:MAG: phosphoglycerate dehydrogenase [Pisciglobus halotolerans]|nr:phosphoglycerate dehydrogenase [Pisciglobus halotolerans]
MTEKGILLLKEIKSEDMKKLEKAAADYTLIKAWDNDSEWDFPKEKIEILYGWDKEIGTALLNDDHSQLRWIQASSAGVDFMNFDKLQEKGILLTTASGIHSIPISESVFGMLLAYTRGIQKSILNQTEKVWQIPKGMEELNEKTMMILGTGHIGTEVGRLAKAFNMKTIGINHSGRKVETMDVIYRQEAFLDHLNEADIIVNSLPLTDETENFFNKKAFDKMKDGSLFINVGRGPSVNQDDLISALTSGSLSFAGLDVFDNEPLESNSPLWEMSNVMITPHISGVAEKFRKRLFRIFEANLNAYLSGNNLPKNLVDYRKEY